MTSKTVAELLGVMENYVSKHGGVFRFHKSYYWSAASSQSKLVDLVRQKIPNATIVDSGNHYHAFVGGAKSGSSQDSFVWVKFTVS